MTTKTKRTKARGRRKTTTETTPRPQSWTCPRCAAADERQLICAQCGEYRPDLTPGEQALALALGPDDESEAVWDELRLCGASDEEILAAAAAALAAQAPMDSYCAESMCVGWPANVTAETIALGFWPISEHRTHGKPDLPRARVADMIRDLLAIPQPGEGNGSTSIDQVEEKPAAKRRKKSQKEKTSSNGAPHDSRLQPAASPEAYEDVPVRSIDVPQGANPRQHFDKEGMERLVASVKLDGVLQPLRLRPGTKPGRYELLAGERRLRAAKTAKLKTVPCVVQACDDARAARIRLAENYVREDLNPIEEAAAFQTLIEQHGFTQRELAEDLGVSQAKIGNAVRLLALPASWQKRLISQEITPTQARELASWAGYPAVLKDVAEALKREQEYDPGPPAGHWLRLVLGDAVRSHSRPLSGSEYIPKRGWFKVALSKKEREREDLDVVEFDGEKRAFNVTLWDELQDAGERRREKRQAKASGSSSSDSQAALTPAEKKERAKKQREQFNKRLYKWKIGWLQGAIADELAQRDPESDPDIWPKIVLHFACQQGHYGRADELTKHVEAEGGYRDIDVYGSLSRLPDPERVHAVMAACCRSWVVHRFETFSSDIPPTVIEAIAADLGITLETHWQLSRDFLELHNKDQLAALAKEWKVQLRTGKRKEIIEGLLEDAAEAKAPKELAKVKAVSLA